MSLKKDIIDPTIYQSQCCFDNWCKLQLYDEFFRLMLTMRGRNSIWWPPTANCGIERLGLEATPTWPAVVLLAGYDPHYSVLQPGSVSRSGLRPPSDHSIIKLWHNYQWHGIRAHQRHTFLKITVDIPPPHKLLQNMKQNKRKVVTC